MELTIVAYEVLDQSRIALTVMADDGTGGRDVVYQASEWVHTPPQATESARNWASWIALRAVAMAYDTAPRIDVYPPSPAGSGEPQRDQEPSPR